MVIDIERRNEILSTIASLGSDGALITTIASHVSCERHTLTKYLRVMELEGLVYHKSISKAKLWFIQKASLNTVIGKRSARQTFREQTLLSIIENLPDGIIITDDKGKVLFMNDYILENYNGSLGTSLNHVLCGKRSLSIIDNLLCLLYNESSRKSVEIVDINNKHVRITASSLIHTDGKKAFMLVISDLTAYKKIQEELAEQKQLLEAERNALNEAAIVAETDLNGKITYANEKFVNVSGYSRDELLGKTHSFINSGYHSNTFFKELWKTISHGKVWHGTVKNKTKDGSQYWLESAIAPVLGKDGRPKKYIAVRFDVTKYLK